MRNKGKYKKLVLSDGIIRYFQTANKLHILAFYLKVKGKYQNGVVYDYKASKLAETMGLTEYKVKTYVRYLKRLGFVERQTLRGTGRKHLWFRSNTRCKELMPAGYTATKKDKRSLLIRDTYTLEDIKALLWEKLIQNVAYQNDYALRRKKRELPETENICKSLKRTMPDRDIVALLGDLLVENGNLDFTKVRPGGFLSQFEDSFLIGYRKLAEKLSVSVYSIWCTVKRLKALKRLRTQTVRFRLGDSTTLKTLLENKYLAKFEGHLSNLDDGLYLTLGTVYSFKEYCPKSFMSNCSFINQKSNK